MSISQKHRNLGLLLLLISAALCGGWAYRHWKHKQTSKPTMTEPANPPPSSAYKPEAIARAALLHFLYEFDPRIDSLPKRIEPALVDRVLREELEKGLPRPQSANQLAALASFYDSRGLVPVALAKLDARGRTEDELTSTVILAAVVGMLGNDAQRRAGRSYYYALLAHPWAAQHFPVLLSCYAAYAPFEPLGPTAQRLTELIASLSAQPEDEAGPQRRELEDLRGLTLPRIAAAAALQTEILALPAPAPRATRLVDIYLGFDERYNEILGPWAIREIQQLARAGHAAVVLSVLRSSFTRMQGRPAEEAWRARTAHAIEFFGGVLSPDEMTQVRPDFKRFDLLSLD